MNRMTNGVSDWQKNIKPSSSNDENIKNLNFWTKKSGNKLRKQWNYVLFLTRESLLIVRVIGWSSGGLIIRLLFGLISLLLRGRTGIDNLFVRSS